MRAGSYKRALQTRVLFWVTLEQVFVSHECVEVAIVLD